MLFVSISNHFYDKNLEGQLDKTAGRIIGDKVLKLQIEMTPDQIILYELNLSRAPVPSYTWADGTCWNWDKVGGFENLGVEVAEQIFL